jgi:DNA modification methylase
VLVDAEGVLIAGHARVEAARLLGMDRVPTLCLDHMGEAEKRAYVIADNRLAGWDQSLLALEFEALGELDFDLTLTGFELSEIDIILDGEESAASPDDDVAPPASGQPVSRLGDLWLLGGHRLLCGNALEAASYATLLGSERVAAVFTDPPFNVPIQGHVSGLGKTQHREFPMAAGEMTSASFTGFLHDAFTHMAASADDGSIHFVCMDWRHMSEVLEAARGIYDELKKLCVWNKSNGGMGSLYRSKHELVFVWKKGRGAHVNNVELGRNGRNRTNVWDYPGQNTFHRDRETELASHPTVKPVALVADALRDVTRRGALVLDPFGGSGTLIVAAERSGRHARVIELDPAYVDVAVRRNEALAGAPARLSGTDETFAEVAARRCRENGETSDAA